MNSTCQLTHEIWKWETSLSHQNYAYANRDEEIHQKVRSTRVRNGSSFMKMVITAFFFLKHVAILLSSMFYLSSIHPVLTQIITHCLPITRIQTLMLWPQRIVFKVYFIQRTLTWDGSGLTPHTNCIPSHLQLSGKLIILGRVHEDSHSGAQSCPSGWVANHSWDGWCLVLSSILP